VVVIDFGGGTLDISMGTVMNETMFKVDKNGGDPLLGGNDFDIVMTDLLKNEICNLLDDYDYFTEPKGRNATEAKKKAYKQKLLLLKKEAERVKIELSKQGSVEVFLDKLIIEKDKLEEIEDNGDGCTIYREDFEEKIRESGLLDRFKKALEKDCKGEFKKPNVVLPVGGTCYIPIIRGTIEKYFTQENRNVKIPTPEEFDPLTAVSKGGAYLASRYSGVESDEPTVIETIPRSIGVEVQGGHFCPLVIAGESLPTRERIHKFMTQREGQLKAVFKIYQAEEGTEYVDVPGSEFIKSLVVNLDNVRHHPAEIELKFSMDENATLKVSAVVRETGTETEEEVDVNMEVPSSITSHENSYA